MEHGIRSLPLAMKLRLFKRRVSFRPAEQRERRGRSVGDTSEADSLVEELDIAKQDVANRGKIPAYFVARYIISWDREKSSGTMAHEKKGIKSAAIVFWLAAETIRQLRQKPGAAGAGETRVKEIRPANP